MENEINEHKLNLRKLMPRALKAAIKGVLLCAVYLGLQFLLAPIYRIAPSLQQILETFVAVYIALTIIATVIAGTIYEHFFSLARATFVVSYLVLSFKDGIFGADFQNVRLIIDFRLFLAFSMLLGLLEFAKAMLHTVDYMNSKLES